MIKYNYYGIFVRLAVKTMPIQFNRDQVYQRTMELLDLAKLHYHPILLSSRVSSALSKLKQKGEIKLVKRHKGNQGSTYRKVLK